MAKTIKVIDLLNKIANGEDVPEKIEVLGIEFEWFEESYRTCNIERKYLTDYCRLDNMLNDTVEIIEEQQDIDIQNIEMISEFLHIGDTSELDVKDERNIKINELIQAVKQLDKQIKEKE